MHSSPIRVGINRRPLRPIALVAGCLLSFRPVFAAGFSSFVSPYPHRPAHREDTTISPPAAARHMSSGNRSHANDDAARSPSTSSPPSHATSSSSSSSSSSSTQPRVWSDLLVDKDGGRRHVIARRRANDLFPPLSPSSHKGSHGRMAIFGGSDRYAGAPYYAARSALQCGIDLVTVFTASEASLPIKCYSPELMVQAVYSIEEMNSFLREEEGILKEMNGLEMKQTMMKLECSEEKQVLLIQSELKNDDRIENLAERLARMKSLEGELHALKERREVYVNGIVDVISQSFSTLHALCIGPGLGRHPLVFSVAEKVILRAIESRLVLIIDADALFMLSLGEYYDLLGELRSYERCVMTPNSMEMRRLHDALLSAGIAADGRGVPSNIIVQKGYVDRIIHDGCTMLCEEEGGLKRCGGIGDVLAGTISAFMAWNAILDVKETSDSGNIDARNHDMVNNVDDWQQRVFASWAAAIVVKKATKVAFQKKKRSMSALDVVGEIGGVINDMESGLQPERCDLMERTKGVGFHE